MAIALPLIAAGISAAGSIGGAYLSNKGKKETKTQTTQRHLMDELLKSLDGGGKYGGLFSANEEDFNKRFREPMMRRFQSQVAPQIQQSFIAGGQQRGTGLEDTLTRAGVDLNDMLNQQYMQYQEGAQNRQSSLLSSILGAGAGAPNQLSGGNAAGQGFSGFLSSYPSSTAGKENIKNIFDYFKDQPVTPNQPDVPKGFEP